jgi:hypothetical protein
MLALAVVGRRAAEDHEAVVDDREGIISRWPIPLLLLGVVARSAFVDVLLSLPLALGVIEDRPHRLFAGGEVGGNV